MPGACPMSMTLLRIGPPEMGGGTIRGQRRHCRNRTTCSSSRRSLWDGRDIADCAPCRGALRTHLSCRQMAVQFRDYYETLGVSKTANDDEIKKAFRKLARQHHPDVAKDKKAAEEKFKQINEAYEVLGDPEKRKKYDELGANWNQPGGGFQPPPGWGAQPGGGFRRSAAPDGGGIDFEFGGTGFSDFFEAFFGGGGRQAGFGGSPFGQRQQAAERGSDVEADIMVTLEEALHGATRPISLRRGSSSKVESYQVKIPKGVHEGQ